MRTRTSRWSITIREVSARRRQLTSPSSRRPRIQRPDRQVTSRRRCYITFLNSHFSGRLYTRTNDETPAYYLAYNSLIDWIAHSIVCDLTTQPLLLHTLKHRNSHPVESRLT